MRLGILVAVIGMLVACGATSAGVDRVPSPAPTDLTNASDGSHYAMHAGDVISVSLRQEGGFGPWDRPSSSDTGVLQPMVDVRATAVRGVTLGRFRAVSAGTVTLDSTASVLCTPGQACPALARAWRVTITVS